MVDDPRPRRTARSRSARRSGAVLLLLLGLAGCGGSDVREALGPARRLSPEDFRAPSSGEERPPVPVAGYIAERPRAPRVAIRSITEAQARGGVEGIDTRPGGPTDLPAAEPRPGDRPPDPAAREVSTAGLSLVDAKIGDLNGVPVIARTWLAPLGDRLRAESAGKPRAEWRLFAGNRIREQLETDLTNEILLAEARSSLTPEQKAGVRAFLGRFEKDVVRGSYGSPTLAEEQLGMGLDQAVRERERLVLIQTQGEKVYSRVQVPWRDIQREYELRYDEFNPKPRAVFRLIRVSSENAATVAQLTEELETADFNALADDERNGLTGEASQRSFEIETSFGETTFFGVEELQAAAVSLSPGEYAGPIDRGAFTYWIYLDRIESGSRSLYEVQRQLFAELTDERRREEAARYLDRLFKRAGITNINDLVVHLTDIAELWYYEGPQR